MNTEKLKEISELIHLVNKTESNYLTIRQKIEEITDINSLYLEDNLLKIICQGYCQKVISNSNGSYYHIIDQADFDYRKQFIDLILQKGINKNIRFGIYSAPLLFYVEDKHLFEYLCSIGFDPNERLTISGFEGRPYFSLHHDFNFEIFLIAKKYGFNKNEKTKSNDELIHLIFNRFSEFNPETLKKIAIEFKDSINIPTNLGLSCLQIYILKSDPSKFMIDNLREMIKEGFDVKYMIQNDVEIAEYKFLKDSVALDIFKAKCASFNFDKNIVKDIEVILNPNDSSLQKKKWWKF